VDGRDKRGHDGEFGLMCIACELGFLGMLEALSPEERARIVREHEQAMRFACEAPQDEAPPVAAGKDERAP